MKPLTITLFAIILFATTSIQAQTSVYLCTETGAFGYCYGTSDAASCAYENCVRFGGESPVNILTTYETGYGAIAVGYNSYGQRVVGVAAGYDNLADARRRAISECSSSGGRDIYIFDSWNDSSRDYNEPSPKK